MGFFTKNKKNKSNEKVIKELEGRHRQIRTIILELTDIQGWNEQILRLDDIIQLGELKRLSSRLTEILNQNKDLQDFILEKEKELTLANLEKGGEEDRKSLQEVLGYDLGTAFLELRTFRETIKEINRNILNHINNPQSLSTSKFVLNDLMTKIKSLLINFRHLESLLEEEINSKKQ